MSVNSHSLTRDDLRRLLATAGGPKGQPSEEPAWQAHDWRQCRCFTDSQLQRLQDFAGQVAAAVGEVFVRFCRRPFEVKVVSVSQHFASQVTEEAASSAAGDYSLPFGAAVDKPVALLRIPAKSARQWTQWLLGGTESGDESQGLSTLEQSLLADVAKAVVEALKAKGAGPAVQTAADLTAGGLPIEWEPMEELLKMTFSIQRTEPQDLSEAAFVLPCSLLSSVAGKTVEGGAVSGSQGSERIMQCLQDIDVPVSASFGTVELSFHDVMGLAVDDVVVLDRSLEDPIDLFVQGRPAFRGFAGQHQGGLAVLITEAVPPGR
jgi:flagellar motor switch protein FliM